VQVEPGQIRVWEDAVTRDKTPFLVLAQFDEGWGVPGWQVLWSGRVEVWSQRRIETFSEVVGAD
jgi:hypothetical protein